MEKVPTLETLAKTVKITIVNKSGKMIDEFNMRGGTNLWVFLKKRGLPIGSACSGVGVCGACNIRIINGSLESISVQNDFEKETLARNQKPQSDRLACLCRVSGDITVQADYW